MWFRRNAINANMAAVYRRYGENYQPVSRLRWVWIIFRSIPMTFFFAAFGIVMFLLHIPAAVWSFITGKPIGLPDLSAMDDECPK